MLPEGETLREVADAMCWRVEGDDWFPPDYAALAKIEAQAQTKRKRAERKAERKLEGERIADMEARGYRFTGFGPDGEMTFTKGKAEPKQVASRRSTHGGHAMRRVKSSRCQG